MFFGSGHLESSRPTRLTCKVANATLRGADFRLPNFGRFHWCYEFHFESKISFVFGTSRVCARRLQFQCPQSQIRVGVLKIRQKFAKIVISGDPDDREYTRLVRYVGPPIKVSELRRFKARELDIVSNLKRQKSLD